MTERNLDLPLLSYCEISAVSHTQRQMAAINRVFIQESGRFIKEHKVYILTLRFLKSNTWLKLEDDNKWMMVMVLDYCCPKNVLLDWKQVIFKPKAHCCR